MGEGTGEADLPTVTFAPDPMLGRGARALAPCFIRSEIGMLQQLPRLGMDGAISDSKDGKSECCHPCTEADCPNDDVCDDRVSNGSLSVEKILEGWYSVPHRSDKRGQSADPSNYNRCGSRYC